VTDLRAGDCASVRLTDGRTIEGVICSVYERSPIDYEGATVHRQHESFRAVLQTAEGLTFNVRYAQLTPMSLLELLVRD